jgi:hypothetical protein
MDQKYLMLADSGILCGRNPNSPAAAARWARRHLMGAIPHYHPPGSGILFKKEDIDAWLEKHRREPVDVNAVVARIMGPVGGKRGAR